MLFPYHKCGNFSINVSEKHELFRRAVREFMEKHVAPYVEEGERKITVPNEVLE